MFFRTINFVPICIYLLFVCLSAGCGGGNNSDDMHANTEAGRLCENVVALYCDWYMNENMPIELNKRQEYKDKIIDTLENRTNMYYIADKLFDDNILNNVVRERHHAIEGRLENDNMQKKKRLFELQDNVYKNLQYTISSKENKDEVVVTVRFYPVDIKRAQESFNKYVLTEAKGKLSALYKDGMTCADLKDSIDEYENNNMNKIKEMREKCKIVRNKVEVIPEPIYNTSLELQQLINNYHDQFDKFIAIQDDAVLKTYENIGYSKTTAEYNIHFYKITSEGKNGEKNIDFKYEDKPFWKEMDNLLWRAGDSNSTLLPINVDQSYFSNSQ